jgi:hypothetical protein
VDPDLLHSEFQVTPDLDPGFWRPITEEKNTAEKKIYFFI